MKLSIKTDFRGVERRLKELPEQVGKQALARTLNEVAAKAQTQMRREIAAEYTIKNARIRQLLGIRRATRNNPVAVLFARRPGKGRALLITEFQAKDTRNLKRGKRRGTGVEFKITKGGPLLKQKQAFIVKGKDGKPVALVRRGAGRHPLRPLLAIDVPQMFNTKRINARVVAQIKKDLIVTFERNARFYLSRV